MNTSRKRAQMLANVERRLVREIVAVRVAIVGLEALLEMPRSKYHGRAGVVTAVMPSPNGRLTALLMILKRNGTGYLNSEGATRQYRPLGQLKFTGRRVFSALEGRAA